ncbi:MAG: hypothetical protein Q9191_008163 [Dirinaria sp. TL-2023a]
MTPVRVRGKKYRKKPTASAQQPREDGRASLRKNQKQTKSKNSKLESSSDSQKNQKQLKRKKSKLKSSSGSRKRVRVQDDRAVAQPAKALSALESLPVEVLEPIFLQSLNLSMPRASNVLGRKLASRHVKSNLFMTVFPSKHHEMRNEPYLLEILGSEPAIGRLQSQMLALKWMTSDFLQSMLEEYTARTIVHFFNQHELGWVDLERPLQVDEAHLPRQFDVSTASKEVTVEPVRSFYKKHYSRVIIYGPMEQQWSWMNESGSKKVTMGINFRDGHFSITVSDTSENETSIILRHESSALYCHSGCRIPQKLLHGPWSDAKCEHLERIFSAGAKIDFTGATTDEEVAAGGLREAMTQNHVRAMHALIGRAGIRECKLMEKDGRSSFFPERAEAFGHLCVGVVVTTELFKFALDNECPVFTLWSLADAMNIRVNWKDKALSRWALKKKHEGDERGQWLWDSLSYAGHNSFD